jgi:hypothetical protein
MLRSTRLLRSLWLVARPCWYMQHEILLVPYRLLIGCGPRATQARTPRRIGEPLQMNGLADFDSCKNVAAWTLKDDQRVLTAEGEVDELPFVSELQIAYDGNNVSPVIGNGSFTEFSSPPGRAE